MGARGTNAPRAKLGEEITATWMVSPWGCAPLPGCAYFALWAVGKAFPHYSKSQHTSPAHPLLLCFKKRQRRKGKVDGKTSDGGCDGRHLWSFPGPLQGAGLPSFAVFKQPFVRPQPASAMKLLIHTMFGFWYTVAKVVFENLPSVERCRLNFAVLAPSCRRPKSTSQPQMTACRSGGSSLHIKGEHLACVLSRLQGWEDSVTLWFLLPTVEDVLLDKVTSFISGALANQNC